METIITQIDGWISAVNGLLSKLWGLPYLTMVFVLCFTVGLVLRYSKKFPNDGIPWVVVICGGVFAPLLSDPKADTLPLRVWVAKNIVVGIVIGLVTWILHRYALKPLARKVSWLGWLAPSDGDTQFFTKDKNETTTSSSGSPPPSP